MSANPLPDSRSLVHPTPKGSVRHATLGNMVPVHCHNCGVLYGHVPEENCTFSFWLCTPCSEKWGDQAHFWTEPDTLFWERVKNEQLDKYQRELGLPELLKVLEDPKNPLTMMIKERMAKGPL